jgi:hypothetical protein
MAEQVSNEELGSILMQAMHAQKNLRPQHDRLLQVQRRLLNQQLKLIDDDLAAMAKEFKNFGHSSELSKVYYIGLDTAARPLATCLELAAQSGAPLALNSDFAAKPDEELFDALVAQRLPERSTTQTEAFSRVEAAFYAVKLSKKHHLPRCIEHLVGIRLHPVTGGPENEEHASPPAAATGEPPQAAANCSVDVEKAHDYLDRACTLVSLGVQHIDLAVAVISTFLDPKEVAEISKMADEAATISKVRALALLLPFSE